MDREHASACAFDPGDGLGLQLCIPALARSDAAQGAARSSAPPRLTVFNGSVPGLFAIDSDLDYVERQHRASALTTV